MPSYAGPQLGCSQAFARASKDERPQTSNRLCPGPSRHFALGHQGKVSLRVAPFHRLGKEGATARFGSKSVAA